MSVLALHHHPDEGEFRRYGAAAITIVLLHVTVIAAALLWYKREGANGVTLQPIFVELAPAPTGRQIQTEDLPPGPETRKAETPAVEPPRKEVVEEQLPPTPPQPEPVVAAPPKLEQKPEPTPAKPQPVREHVKKPDSKRLVEQSTTAKANRVAPESAAASGAGAAAAAASYYAILAAHLQRVKRNYDGSMQGKASVTFTVTRNGRVTSTRLAQSSGFAALDQEALAVIQRAQPLPPFLPEMRESSKSYTLPFNFHTR